MKGFLNSPETLVIDSLEGLLHGQEHLARLDGFPNVKVVLDAKHDGSKVAVVSGGGSGHEPAMAGYVGAGMLAAAVCGEVFASPSEDAVLAAIRAVTGPAGVLAIAAGGGGEFQLLPATSRLPTGCLLVVMNYTGDHPWFWPGSAFVPASCCLLVVMNYTGDRLNFGLAAERAKAEGLAVEMVITADDCALPGKTAVGRRGIAGTVLVHKVAGAAAAAGADLDQVKRCAEHAASSLGTMGCSVTVCTMPGQKPSDRLGTSVMEMELVLGSYWGLGAGEMEMGLGIHGEPGAYKCPVKPAKEIVADLLGRITSSDINYLPVKEGERLALLVNNLGATTPLELQLATKEAVKYVEETLKAKLERLWVGTFMTSLNMHGLSLTLLCLDDQLLQQLDAPAQAPAWPALPGHYAAAKDPIPVPKGSTDEVPISEEPQEVSPFGQRVRRCLAAACEVVLAAEDEVNALDAKVGDGDCGSTLAKGASAILGALDRLPAHDLPATLLAVAQLMGRSMGGTSGAVYKVLLTAAAGALKAETPGAQQGQQDPAQQGQQQSDRGAETPWGAGALGAALEAGAAAASKYGGAVAGSRTMLDALLPAAAALREAATAGACAAPAAQRAARAAAEGAEATKAMSAAAGRSSYVPEDVQHTVPDPGAVEVAKWMGAIADTLQQQ
ncbi:hypothetical protein N2152v2_000934 [Parachlorella kessleri]